MSDEKYDGYDGLQEEIDKHTERISSAQKSISVLENLRGLRLKRGSVYAYGGHVQLESDEPEVLVRGVLRFLGVRRADKRFDEYSGDAVYKVETDDVDVEVKGRPARCEVVKTEVTEDVPATTRTVTKYKLKNPRECLGLTSDDDAEEPQIDPVDTAILANDEAQAVEIERGDPPVDIPKGGEGTD